MSRWFASRWLVLSAVAMAGAFWLAWRFEDPGTFAEVAMVAIGLGQVNNTWGSRRKRERTETEEDLP